MRKSSLPLTLLYGAGLLGVFVGERLIGAGSWRALTGVGVGFVVLACVLRVLRLATAGPGRAAEQRLLLLYALGVCALIDYFMQSDLWVTVAGRMLERDAPKLAGVLAVLWPVLITATLVPLILVEMAYAAMTQAPRIEIRRIDDALLTGLGVTGALVFCFSVAYVASERDHKADLSYFRTARAGESTKRLVQTLDKPLSVALFFPPANEVADQVTSYFDDLTKLSPDLKVKLYDQVVEITTARDLGVTGNGVVVIYRGAQREQLAIGMELETARSKLARLDRDIQRMMVRVARPERTLYFTTGHGERSVDAASETDKRPRVHDLRELLRQQGYAMHDLGPAEGLATDVPKDASAVLILGPDKPFLAEELAALDRYRARGGRLLIALDPESKQDYAELLKPLGVKFVPAMLANDQAFWRRSSQKSDRINLLTASYSSHPSATTLSQLRERAPLVLVGAGALEELQPKAPNLLFSPTVFSLPSTFVDLNGNFELDAPPERRQTWTLAGAVVRRPETPKKDNKPDPGASPDAAKAAEEPEQRALVVADSNVFTDGIILNYGPAYLALDGIKWLVGDEAITGEVTTEEDVPIAHTKRDDVVWFYGSTFLAPGLVLGVGYLATRRKKRIRRSVNKEVLS